MQSTYAHLIASGLLAACGMVAVIPAAHAASNESPPAKTDKQKLEDAGYTCGRMGIGGYLCTKKGSPDQVCDNAGTCSTVRVTPPRPTVVRPPVTNPPVTPVPTSR